MKPPAHLSSEMTTWWKVLGRRYRFGPQHFRVLQCACEAWDRKTEAAGLVAQEGIYMKDRFGVSRGHPAVAIERDSRIAFVRAMRELALADDDIPTDTRPPRLRGYKGRK